jgi:hypothetical protein
MEVAMFDKNRFKNAQEIESDGRVVCCLCALEIADKETYLDGGEGNSAHMECVEKLKSDNFPFDRDDTQANLDKQDYHKPVSLLATLSKIEVRSGGEKRIKLTFEVKITEALAELCVSLGINAYDFLPGDQHKYSAANLESGEIYWAQWFLDWSRTTTILLEKYARLVEVGHVGRFKAPKIITRDVACRDTTILVIQAEGWKSDIELLKNAYVDLGEVVSLKLRKYERIDPQQSLPMDSGDDEMSADAQEMAGELDKQMEGCTTAQGLAGKESKKKRGRPAKKAA